MPFFRRHLSRWTPAAVAMAALVGCGEEPVPVAGQEIEGVLPAQMTERLDGLRVQEADCIYLSEAETRCFARGTGPAGAFELPVSVSGDQRRPVWEVAEPDVVAARRGTVRPPLALGSATTVVGEGSERVGIRVTELIHPLEVSYRENPAQPGTRYVGVRLTFANEGDQRYVDQPQERVNLRLSNGALLAPAYITEGLCATESLARIDLAPGQREEGCIAFEVPASARPDRISIEVGSSHRVLEWRLGLQGT